MSLKAKLNLRLIKLRKYIVVMVHILRINYKEIYKLVLCVVVIVTVDT